MEATLIQTNYGTVPLTALLHAYEKRKQYEAAKLVASKTPEGRAYNRQKAKEYYERNRDKVLAKRALQYETNHDVLLNRSKEYYHAHNEVCKERMRKRREAGQGPKIESVSA
jgi:hypothetical protein